MEIIAEIGVNHNNQRSTLMDLVRRVIDCDVDTIKLQRFKSSDEISSTAAPINYQVRTTDYESQLEMAQGLELSDELLLLASEHVVTAKKKLLISPFDLASARFIKDEVGSVAVKVPSPEITNKSLIEYLAQNFKKLYLSTGASYLHEVARAIKWATAFDEIRPEIELMHCVSQYPAPLGASNLRCIETMRENFALNVGMSDHSEGLIIPVVCKMLNSSCLEKHVTLDKRMVGPDHSASATIEELSDIVRVTRDQEALAPGSSLAEIAETLERRFGLDVVQATSLLGSGIKEPSFAEVDTRDQIRKSFYINVAQVEAGDLLTLDNISAKRPWNSVGIDASDVDQILGKALRRSLTYDSLVTLGDIT